VAAGRTDSGVHARGQALHFDLPTADVVAAREWDAKPGKLERFLNAHLPPDVRVWNVSLAPPPAAKNLAVRGEWHAMYNAGAFWGYTQSDNSNHHSLPTTDCKHTNAHTQTQTHAVGKLYTYRFSTRAVADPLERRTRAHVPTRAREPALDIEKLAALAPLFEGTHDFQNFANRLEHKRRASKKGADFTTERTVYRCRLLEDDGGPGHYRLEVHLEGALQRMVRNMMGGLWSVARGDMEEAELRRALEGPVYPTGRSLIRAAPAHGLTLEWVYYDDF
jgi:tRNA pseudouridine38-40 synthase